MPLSTTNIGSNNQVPGVVAEVFIPDQLIAGNAKLVTDNITLAAGNLRRGAVLGIVTASGNCVLSVKNAADGSQNPVAILADDADASGGPVQAGAYIAGEFNAGALIFDASWQVAALKTALRPQGIYVKNAVSAADPT